MWEKRKMLVTCKDEFFVLEPKFICQLKMSLNWSWLSLQFFVSSSLFFSRSFLRFQRTFQHFHLIWNCHLQFLCVWKSLEFVIWERVNLLPDDKILDWSKFKQFANNNFKFNDNSRKFSKQVENTVGKGEIARYEQFLLFPLCFQKACFRGVSKGVTVWEWVKGE